MKFFGYVKRSAYLFVLAAMVLVTIVFYKTVMGTR